VSSNTGHNSNAASAWQIEYQLSVYILSDALAVSQITDIRDFYGGKISDFGIFGDNTVQYLRKSYKTTDVQL
jgi:hypothetical protein